MYKHWSLGRRHRCQPYLQASVPRGAQLGLEVAPGGGRSGGGGPRRLEVGGALGRLPLRRCRRILRIA